MPAQVAPFPWHELPAYRVSEVRAWRATLRTFAGLCGPAELAESLGTIVGGEVRVSVLKVEPCDFIARPDQVSLALTLPERSARVAVVMEPQLVTLVLRRLLGQEPRIDALEGPISSALTGSAAAVVTELLRRTASDTAIELADVQDVFGVPGVSVTALVRVEGRSFAVLVHGSRLGTGTRAAVGDRTLLGRLGELELSLPVIGGVCTISAQELAALEVGDALVPGAGMWMDRGLTGKVLIAAPAAERALSAQLSDGGRIVLGAEHTSLTWGTTMSNEQSDTLTTAAVLDAPLVVRIEVASVALSAREWADLKPGDILETRKPIGEHVVLRIAGREVARGELVSVDGELGVRIRSVQTGAEP